MKPGLKNKRHRISLPLRDPNLRRLSSKSQAYNSSSLILTSEEVPATSSNRLNLTNIQLFKLSTKQQSQDYPSAFALIRDLPFTPAKKVTLHHLEQINFPVLMYTVKELVEFSTSILLTSEYAAINFSESTLQKLMETVALRYNDIAYHNFSHAFSLTLVITDLYS